MTFIVGLIIGLFVGASMGALAIALVTAGKVADLQDQVDAYKASGWPL